MPSPCPCLPSRALPGSSRGFTARRIPGAAPAAAAACAGTADRLALCVSVCLAHGAHGETRFHYSSFFFPGRSRVAGRGGCRRKAAEVALRGSGRSRSSAQAPASPFPPVPRSPTGRVLSTQLRDNPGLGRGQGARGGGQRRAGHDPGTSCGKASGASHVELLTRPWTSPCSRASSQTQRCKGFVLGEKKKKAGNCPIRKVPGCGQLLQGPWGTLDGDRDTRQHWLFTVSQHRS